MFFRSSTLAAAALLGSLGFAANSASAAQCTSSATPVCARPSCSITIPVTCTCKEWKCVEKGGKGTGVLTRGAAATAVATKPVLQQSRAPMATRPMMPMRRLR